MFLVRPSVSAHFDEDVENHDRVKDPSLLGFLAMGRGLKLPRRRAVVWPGEMRNNGVTAITVAIGRMVGIRMSMAYNASLKIRECK